jgi:heme iron utilization protein
VFSLIYEASMHANELAVIATLIRGQRVAALATLRDDGPFASMVAYAAEPDFGGLLLHLSQLAVHTKQLLAAPQSSLLICERDDDRDDPQTLARIALSGTAIPIAAESSAYEHARAQYLARLPSAAMQFELPDFVLFRFVPSEARYIGGFGRIFSLTPEHLHRAALS